MHTANKLRLVVAAGTAAALIGCDPAASPKPNNHTDDSQITSAEVQDDDDRECDAEDKAKREEPDCGRYVNGTWVFWTWAARGQLTAPPAWTRASEPQPTTNVRQPAPQSAANTTRPAPRDSGSTPRQRSSR